MPRTPVSCSKLLILFGDTAGRGWPRQKSALRGSLHSRTRYACYAYKDTNRPTISGFTWVATIQLQGNGMHGRCISVVSRWAIENRPPPALVIRESSRAQRRKIVPKHRLNEITALSSAAGHSAHPRVNRESRGLNFAEKCHALRAVDITFYNARSIQNFSDESLKSSASSKRD